METFDDIIKGDKPVLVDFFATWCGPCRMMAPVIEELAEEYDGKVKIGKLDVDENSDIAARYGVMSIPTIILFKNGEVFSKSVGLQDKEGEIVWRSSGVMDHGSLLRKAQSYID